MHMHYIINTDTQEHKDTEEYSCSYLSLWGEEILLEENNICTLEEWW